MVSFTCNACGQSMRKNQVEKHYQTACRNCSVLSCIDCGKDFPGDTYADHTSCISEAEKYQGNLYQAKENKGEEKQRAWMKRVAGASISDPRMSSLLSQIAGYSNVPRKQKKFENFCKNSLRVYEQKILEQLWTAFSNSPQAEPAAEEQIATIIEEETEVNGNANVDVVDSKVEKQSKKTRKRKDVPADEICSETSHQNGCTNQLDEGSCPSKNKKRLKNNENNKIDVTPNCVNEQLNNEKDGVLAQTKFNWHKGIKHILKQAEGHQLGVKKLRRKVLAAYEEHGCDYHASTRNEMQALFDKKLKTYPKVKISKEIVQFIS